jgi:D-alanyl-D-alanine carboxypeptidase (penicillin-binding protein 5/6)
VYYKSMRRQRNFKKRTGLKFIAFLMLFGMGLLAFNYVRPLPEAAAAVVTISSDIQPVKLQWPTRGYAAIGAQGFGLLESRGSANAPRPTASLAKLITALAVLEKHPLKSGEPGPTIMLTKADTALFEKYYAKGGSVVTVKEGEKITLYQALQAILLASANNMADSLALWAFGSMPDYVEYANKMVERLGLIQTEVADDASGMSPGTVSTSRDLIRLGELSLENPVIAEIVAQRSATIPVHGAIASANSRLGFNNIIGIKTGLTDEAGGCFLFAAKHTVAGRPLTIIGVISGAETLRAALAESEPLLNSAKPHFSVKTPIKAGEPFATITTPWLASAEAVAQKDVTLLAWHGTTLTPRVELSNINGSVPAGARVGMAFVSSGTNTASTPLVLRGDITGPSWQWRIRRF